ncbi:MAG: hypothetical protein ACMUJM_05525 [bacterium]
MGRFDLFKQNLEQIEQCLAESYPQKEMIKKFHEVTFHRQHAAIMAQWC